MPRVYDWRHESCNKILYRKMRLLFLSPILMKRTKLSEITYNPKALFTATPYSKKNV